MMDTSTTHTRYESEDVHWFHTTSEAEGDNPVDFEIGLEVPYCEYWEAVRQVTTWHESASLLGTERRSLQDTMGEPSILTDFESTEGTDECYWRLGYC